MQNEHVNQASQMLEESRDDTEDKWLTFWLDEQLYAASITNVEQIVGMQPITEVPEYPAYGKGVISLRGNIVPLIDMRLRLGKPEAVYTDRTCIIITRVNDKQMGFIVDEVDAVVNIKNDHTLPLPTIGNDDTKRYLEGVTRLTNDSNKEKIVLLLSVQKVLFENDITELTGTQIYGGK